MSRVALDLGIGAAVALAVLWRDRIGLALLVLILPQSWLCEAFEKAFAKGKGKTA